MGEKPLLDPNQYTVIPRVAVLDEVNLPVPAKDGTDGYEYFNVTPEFLQKVAQNGNRREAETGDLCPIIIGRHTKKNAAETSQPDIVGFARNWSVGQLGKTNRMAAFADFWIRNEDLERVKKHPRRSAEIWRNRAEIDPIALLGATTPERDLGMLPIALQRRDKQEISATFYFDRALDMPNDTETQDAGGDKGKKQDATPSMSDLIQTINKMAAQMADMNAKIDQLTTGGVGGGGEEVPGGAGAGGADDGGQMSDEEIEQFIKELEAGGGGQSAPVDGGQSAPVDNRQTDRPVQTMGYPGGSNTYVAKETPVKQSREESAEIARLRQEVEALQLERARDEITGKVKELIGKGVLVEDPDAEIRDILALPAAMRPAQLSRMEKQYRRAPIGGLNSAVIDSNGVQVRGSINEADKNEVIQLARSEGLSFEAAFKKRYGRFPWEQAKL